MMNAAVPQNLANRRMRKLFLAGRSGTCEERDTMPWLEPGVTEGSSRACRSLRKPS